MFKQLIIPSSVLFHSLFRFAEPKVHMTIGFFKLDANRNSFIQFSETAYSLEIHAINTLALRIPSTMSSNSVFLAPTRS